jgi:hypothetical protein
MDKNLVSVLQGTQLHCRCPISAVYENDFIIRIIHKYSVWQNAVF